MNKTLIVCTFLSLAFITGCKGQTRVTVTAEAYFDGTQGGYPNFVGCKPPSNNFGPHQESCPYYGFPVPPSSQMRWGESAGSGVSGLGFEPVVNQSAPIGFDFYIGQLTHFNFPIYNASNATNLNLRFTINDQANIVNIGIRSYVFLMLIDETPNEPPCTYNGTSQCPDKISFANSFNANTTFPLGSVQYTIRLQGFKENSLSSSSPVTDFISEENSQNAAYLFARIEAACPSSCSNNGLYYLLDNGNCACNCSASTCPANQTTTSNCSCACPNPNACNNGNGGILLQQGCQCQCNACTAPRILSPINDCSCICPSGYCGSGVVNNTNTCSCTCPQTPCAITNEVRDARCNCGCTKQCTYPKVEDPSPNICACVCNSSISCPSGFAVNPSDCGCQCVKTCPNGQILDSANCVCGDCIGNWQKDPETGLCTVCGITGSSCLVDETFNAQACKCLCTNLTCDINLGFVVDQNQECACRKCIEHECICGNGIVEPGEDCDNHNNTLDLCCQACKFTHNLCDDTSPCTSDDICQNGTCKGNYDCALPTACKNTTCDLVLGCVSTNAPLGSACGSLPYDMCHNQCDGMGNCQSVNISCGEDMNIFDCITPVCIPSTGLCGNGPTSGNGCNDNNLCTTSDTCVNGTCTGIPMVCSVPECQTAFCKFGSCVSGENLPNDSPCNADSDACTVGDKCFDGLCNAGPKKVCQVPANETCKYPKCENSTGGTCLVLAYKNEEKVNCTDGNVCTIGDVCIDGTCKGTIDPNLSKTAQCGVPPASVQHTTTIAFSVAGAVAAIGAIVGMAFLIKKIRNSRIDDPDTWSPDTFHSIGSNPLYKGNQNVVTNRMYEGSN